MSRGGVGIGIVAPRGGYWDCRPAYSFYSSRWLKAKSACYMIIKSTLLLFLADWPSAAATGAG